jgi:hypothetical protein
MTTEYPGMHIRGKNFRIAPVDPGRCSRSWFWSLRLYVFSSCRLNKAILATLEPTPNDSVYNSNTASLYFASARKGYRSIMKILFQPRSLVFGENPGFLGCERLLKNSLRDARFEPVCGDAGGVEA